MTLDQFIKEYDKEGSIVLIEGKRDVPEEDRDKLIALGRLIASRTEKMIFRSGNAEGSDQFFSEGVASVDSNRLQAITPYSGHRSKENLAEYTISMDDIELAQEDKVLEQSKIHKGIARMIDPYLKGVRNKITQWVPYIIRDTVKVIGAKNIKPAAFAIFYDDLKHPKKKGTGHTMKVCDANNIPYIDQSEWFDWIKQSISKP